MSKKLTRVASSDTVVNGVAVARDGRIFCSLPRWSATQACSVAEVSEAGQLVPYPDAAWNEWDLSRPVGEHFVMAHSVFIDEDDQLWVVDDGSPFFEPFIPGAPKLVQIDLATDTVVRVFPLPAEMLPPAALLGHLRRFGDHVFVTESRGRAIIVLDIKTGAMRRVLGSHPSTEADPNIVPSIDGRDFRKASTGKPQLIHVNLLEVSDDGKWLYYCPLFGPALFRVEMAALINPDLPPEELEKTIERVCAIPPLAGITSDKDGGFFLCSITENAVLRLRRNNQLETVIQDDELSFPNEPCLGPDNALYIPCSQVHRLPMFHADGASRVKHPFYVYKVGVNT